MDGFSKWDPKAFVNDQIRAQENIRTNSDYRSYLQKNGDRIIELNHNFAYQHIGSTVPFAYSVPKVKSDLEESYKNRHNN
jgi:hypothetical protein